MQKVVFALTGILSVVQMLEVVIVTAEVRMRSKLLQQRLYRLLHRSTPRTVVSNATTLKHVAVHTGYDVYHGITNKPINRSVSNYDLPDTL